ncbi:MAG TPA: hypothetical protein PK299_14410, partial [Anaerolineales bacterium]|nr:hypothetical protein [Anaerolineales bacterium]
PTDTPTLVPTATWTEIPTDTPTSEPTATWTETPTDTPTLVPTATWTEIPTDTPTSEPTATWTETPTDTPTLVPTATWTEIPTGTPTATKPVTLETVFTPTFTKLPPSATSAVVASRTPSQTPSNTSTVTTAPSATQLVTASATIEPTGNVTATATNTSGGTITNTPSPTLATSTATHTQTPTLRSNTATSTPSPTVVTLTTNLTPSNTPTFRAGTTETATSTTLASGTATFTATALGNVTATRTAPPEATRPANDETIVIKQVFSVEQAQIGQLVMLEISIENGEQPRSLPLVLNLYLPEKLLIEGNEFEQANLSAVRDYFAFEIQNLQTNEKRIYKIPLRVAENSQFGDLLESKISSEVNGSEKFIETAKLRVLPSDLPVTGYPYQISALGQTFLFLALLLIALGGIAVFLGVAARLIRASGGKSTLITGTMVSFGVIATLSVLVIGLTWGVSRNDNHNSNPIPTSTQGASARISQTPDAQRSLPAPALTETAQAPTATQAPATPATTAPPVEAIPSTQPPTVENGGETALPNAMRLMIPNLGIDREIVPVKFGDNGWDVNALNDEVGLLAGTGNRPEAVLAMALTGHATLKDGLTEGDFAKLSRLQPTDEIILRWQGVDYIYLPTVQDVVQPNTIDRILIKDGSLLLLVTCIERDLLSGEFSSRQVTEAKLVRKVPSPTAP